MREHILVLNAGSSTLKFAVVDPDSGERAVEGVEEWLDDPEARRDTVRRLLHRLRDHPLRAAGHRVVHGGEHFTTSVRIDDGVIDAVRACSHLAPLHNPANLAGIEAITAARPDLPQVAVFDTAFHQTMPPAAFRYAVPEAWYAEHGVRRYGFHGTSHRYVSGEAAVRLGRPLEELALVTAHLGNGCSACAVLGGRSIDTTMGLTPLEGLVMGTRSGDVDPGLFDYLAGRTGLDVRDITNELNGASGLLGLSRASNDMRTVEAAAEAGDGRAQLALDVFVHRLGKAIAGLVAGLGRLDALVFTGGIGEHSSLVRSRVLDRLRFLDLAEDPDANAVHGRDTGGRISHAGPAVALVVPTDEELLIARDTAALVDPWRTRDGTLPNLGDSAGLRG
ncbi:MAG: acetate/propionate family kinase [Acidimicrobiales bacterium]